MKKITFVFSLSVAIFLFWFWQKNVDFWQNLIIETYQLDNIQAEKLKTNLLTPSKYLLLQIFVSITIFALSALLFWQQNKISELFTDFLHYLQTQFKTFLKPFQNLSKINLFAFGLVLCLINGYTFFRLHHKIPHIDEAFGYVHFSSKGFLVSALYYPNPNNHIFYNLCVAFWDIFVPNKIWAMRLPSILSFLLLQILLFRFFLKKYSFLVALTAFSFFALLAPVQAYSTMGRGYLLQMLFLWLAVTFLCKIAFLCIERSRNAQKTNIFEHQPSNRTNQILFIAFSVAGFYTIPTYLYYFLAIGFLALTLSLPNYQKIFVLLKIHLWTILFVILIYLPIFLFNGKENLFSENWQQFAEQEFATKKYEYFADFGDFWVGIENTYALFWGIVGGAMIVFLLQKNDMLKNKWFCAYLFVERSRNEQISTFFETGSEKPLLMEYKSVLLLVTMPLVALLIMFVQQKLLPERIWLGFACSWVVLLVSASQMLKKYANILMILLILGEIFVQFHHLNKAQNDGYTDFAKVYATLPFAEGDKIFSNDLIYQNLLAFYSLQDCKGLQIDYSHKSKPYDWIILEKNKNVATPKNYSLFAETPFVAIFKRQ